jgi:methionine-rich copper-binding protein CopC
MTKLNSPRRRILVVLLAALAVTGASAAQHFTATSSADNPTLTGDFCTGLCMTATWNGVAYGTTNRAVLALKPGTYTLTVNDTSAVHDFVLRSCPGSVVVCSSGNPLAATTPITTQAQMGTVSQTEVLAPGTYRLFCSVDGHEGRGMFADFEVALPVVTNSAPVVGGIATATVTYGGSFSPPLTVSASDPDTAGSGLTASATGLPAGLSLSVSSTSDPATLPGTRTWTVGGSVSASPGTYPVTATVTDSDGHTGTTSFTVVVTKAPLTVSADHKSRLFGASNPPLTATLSGFVLGQTAATSDVTGSAACTTTAVSFSPPGDYPITCTVGSLSSTNYSFGPFVANTLSVTTTGPCLTGTRTSPLTVTAGEAFCAGAGAEINGPITVQAGGALVLDGATVSGGIRASGATVVRVCGSTVSGPLAVSGSTGLVLVGGDAATGPCAGNTITGPASLTKNSGGIEFNGNQVGGPLTISGTTGTLPPPDTGSVHATGNTVSGPVKITP